MDYLKHQHEALMAAYKKRREETEEKRETLRQKTRTDTLEALKDIQKILDLAVIYANGDRQDGVEVCLGKISEKTEPLRAAARSYALLLK